MLVTDTSVHPSRRARGVLVALIVLVGLAVCNSTALAVTIPWVATSTSTAYSDVVGTAVSTGADGTSIATGRFTGTDVDFGDGVRRASANGGASDSLFVQKLSASGSVLWVRTTTSTATSNSGGNGVGTLPDGSSIIIGSFRGVDVDLGDGVPRTSAQGGASFSTFIEKLSSNGTVLWVSVSTSTASSLSYRYGVSALADGTSIITGYFYGTDVDLGDGVPRSSANAGTSPSAFVLKLSATGAVLWVRASTATAPSYAGGAAVSVFADGSSIITGYFDGTAVDFGDGVPRTSAEAGASDSAFAMKLSATGSVLWVWASTATAPSSASGDGVSALADGSSIVVGSFYGTDVDLGDGVPRATAGDDYYSTFTAKLSPNGTVRWVIATTSAANGVVFGRGVSALPDGTSITTGPFEGTAVDFGDGVLRNAATTTNGTSVFVQKLLDAPQAPDAPAAAAGIRSATVAISPLAGGSVTSYAVTSSPVGGTCTIKAPATSCAVAGLTGGTSYTFTARAANAAGESAASLPSNPVTPTAPSVAKLSASVLRDRLRLVSGQSMRIGIRVMNTGTASAKSIRACLTIPANLTVTNHGTARRSGRNWCFTIKSITAGAKATRYVTVRAHTTKTIVRTIRGRASATGLTTTRAPAKMIGLAPRQPEAVTG